MKKSLVALAALAATSAFAQVTLTGTFDMTYSDAKTTFGDGSSRSLSSVGHSNQGTTAVKFNVAEDLGGGLKAVALYELDFAPVGGSLSTQPDNKDQLQNGEVFVGLAGGFGSFKIGAPNQPSLSAQGARAPFGTKNGGGFGGVSGTGKVRMSNSMRYDTPTVAGFTGSVAYAPGASAKAAANFSAAVAATSAATDLGLAYVNGPLGVTYARFSQSGATTIATLAASYTVGPVKLTYGTHNENVQAATAAAAGTSNGKAVGTSTGNNIAAQYTMGNMVVMFNTGKLDDQTAGNLDRTITALGLKYNLSKNTSAYVRMVTDSFDAASAAAATEVQKVQTTLFGMQTNF